MYFKIIDAREMNAIYYRQRTSYCHDEGQNFSFRETKIKCISRLLLFISSQLFIGEVA